MSIRAKTKQRLVILLAVAGLVLVGLVATYFLLRAHRISAARAARVAGIEAADHGDYQTAVDQLRIYLQRFSHDPEANYRYAMARMELPAPENRQVLDALSKLRDALQYRPDYPEAHRAILDVYTKARMNAEAIAEADQMLAHAPDDRDALYAKGLALMRQRHFSEAHPIIEHYLALRPDDFSMQLTALELLASEQRPPEEILARAQALQAKYPDNPRFEALMAAAYETVHDRPNATTWALKAAAHAPADPQALKILVDLFDLAGRFDESLIVLEKTADAAGPETQRVLVERLWQTGQFQKVLDVAERSRQHAPKTLAQTAGATDMLGYSALALVGLHRQPEATAIAKAMGEQDDNPRAQAWKLLLDTTLTPGAAPRELLETFRKAVTQDGRIAPLRFALGQAYDRIGETELALHEWNETARLAPAWVLPFSSMARLLARTGRLDQALADQSETTRRAPNNIETGVTVAIVQSACLTRVAPDKVAPMATKLLLLVKDIQQADPANTEVPPLTVSLLVAAGRPKDAAEALQKILDDTAHPPSADLLLRLTHISHDNRLGMDQQCLDRYRKIVGETPSLLVAEAQLLAQQGKPAEGKQLLESGRDHMKDPAAQQGWALAYAQYLDHIHDPGAMAAIKGVGEAQADNLTAQDAVLHSEAAAADRQLKAQSIERIKAITGDTAVGWRLAQAQWLLEGPAAERDKNTASAIALLHDVTQVAPYLLEPRLLMAEALTRQSNRTGAIEQLKAAQDIAPQSAGISLELARQLQAQGDSQGSAAEIDRVLSSPQLSAVDARRVAEFLAQRGDAQRAVALLEKIDGATQGAEAPADLLLAQLYASLHEPQKARAIVTQVLAQPKLTAQGIEMAATILVAIRKSDEVPAALALLDKPGVIPAGRADIKELVIARVAQAQGNLDQAGDHFKKATEAGPTNEAAWQAYLGFLARQGKIEALMAADALAAKSLPPTSPLLVLANHADLLGGLKSPLPALMQPLVASLVEDPAHQANALEAIRVLGDAIKSEEAASRTLDRLAPIADHAPQFTALQLTIAHLDLLAGRWEHAEAIANRAMAADPYAEEPASLAFQALAGAGQWDDAIGAARKWRSLGGPGLVNADLAIAQIQIRRQHPEESLRVLAPYMAPAKANPDALAEVISIQVQALTMQKKWGDVVALMREVAPKSPRCRAIWMELATISTPDVATGGAWLTDVGGFVPDNQPDERLALAEHWQRMGERLHDAAAVKAGRDMIEALAQRPTPTYQAVLALACLYDTDNNLSRAEALYRQTLKLKGDNALAMNNLAMVLVRQADAARTQPPEEALTLADTAVKLQPRMPQYLDTLATVLVRSKQFDRAIAAERQAIALDPAAVDFPIGLAETMVTAGQKDDARKVLRQIDTMITKGAPVSAPVQARLDAVRLAVGIASANH